MLAKAAAAPSLSSPGGLDYGTVRASGSLVRSSRWALSACPLVISARRLCRARRTAKLGWAGGRSLKVLSPTVYACVTLASGRWGSTRPSETRQARKARKADTNVQVEDRYSLRSNHGYTVFSIPMIQCEE